MCVSHRHLDRLMTHQFSYREEADANLAECRIKPVLVALQRLPLHINKNSALPTGTGKQLLKCRQRDRVQRNVPRIPVFALRDGDQLASEINSASNQSILFAGPHARMQGDLELRHMVGIVGEDHRAQP
jgi:hypothetical protein